MGAKALIKNLALMLLGLALVSILKYYNII